ncbi:MAG TPA: hypothetical protein VF840_02240 [Terriglobales bacterium]
MSVTASPPAPAMPVPEPKLETKAPRISIVLGSLPILLFETGCAIFVFANRISILTTGAATGLVLQASWLHSERVRLPLLALATIGSVFNLFVLSNARRLRRKPEAQWRIKPLRFRDKLRNGIVFSASVLTLVMVISELVLHPSIYPGWHH